MGTQGGPEARHSFYRRTDGLRPWEKKLQLLIDHPEGSVRLWAIALLYAIRELYSVRPELSHHAYHWFCDEQEGAEEIGSFLFICEQLELDKPGQIRHDIFEDHHHGRRPGIAAETPD